MLTMCGHVFEGDDSYVMKRVLRFKVGGQKMEGRCVSAWKQQVEEMC